MRDLERELLVDALGNVPPPDGWTYSLPLPGYTGNRFVTWMRKGDRSLPLEVHREEVRRNSPEQLRALIAYRRPEVECSASTST